LCREEVNALAEVHKVALGNPAFLTVLKPPEDLGEENSVADFLKVSGDSSEAYVDVDKQLFAALGQVEKMPLWALLTPTSIANILRSKRSGFEGDLKGEGLLGGGGFVLSASGEIEFAWQETNFGVQPDMSRVKQALDKCAADAPK